MTAQNVRFDEELQRIWRGKRGEFLEITESPMRLKRLEIGPEIITEHVVSHFAAQSAKRFERVSADSDACASGEYISQELCLERFPGSFRAGICLGHAAKAIARADYCALPEIVQRSGRSAKV